MYEAVLTFIFLFFQFKRDVMKHHSCRAFTFIVYNLLLLVICVEINADKGNHYP